MLQILFWLIVSFIGFYFGKFCIGLSSKYAFSMSFQLGIGLSVFTGILLLFCNFELPLYYSMIINLFLIVCIFYRCKEHNRLSKGVLKSDLLLKSFLLAGFIILFSAIFVKYNLAMYTSDSFGYEGFGRVISISRQFIASDEFVNSSMRKEPMLALVHAISFSLGIVHLNSFYPLCAIFVILGTVIFSVSTLRRTLTKKTSLILLICSVCCLICTKNFILHSFFVLPNMIATLFLSSGLFCFYRYTISDRKVQLERIEIVPEHSLLVCSIVMFGFGTMVRPEFRFYVLIPFFFIARESKTAATILPLIYVPLAYVWPLVRFFHNNGENIGAYASLSIDIFSLFSFLFILFGACRSVRFKDNFIYLSIYLSIVMVIIVTYFSFTANFGICIQNLYSLMFKTGNWGIFWYIIIPLICLSVFFDNNTKSRNIFLILFGGFLCLRIVIYTVFRSSGVVDWQYMGSGNRILLHIIPFLVFYIVSNFSKRLSSYE